MGLRRFWASMLAAMLAMSLGAGPALADVLERIKIRNSIRIGHRTDAPPFSYVNDKGEPAGLAVALCKAVARSLAGQLGLSELRTRFVPVTAETRFDMLQEDDTDLHCGPATATLSRRQTLDFSILYFVDGAVAVMRPGNRLSVFELEGGKIGTVAGTTTEQVVFDLITRNGLQGELVTFPTHAEGLTELVSGRIAAYFGDSAIMQFMLRTKDLEGRLEILPEEFSFEPYALVMKRGEDDLRLAVDRALSEIYDAGLIYNLIRNEMGNLRLNQVNRTVYQIVGLPG
ncbi:MAG: amino acid ABC transporter substrate-binding protein [Pseudomonadota bacterium]